MTDPLLVGARGRYRVLGEIGRGAFGVTYGAIAIGEGDAEERPVVIKALRLRGAVWKEVELFQREASVLRSLSHPGIPAWIDDFVLGGAEATHGFALVMERVPGRNLREIVRGGGMARAALLEVMGDVLEVLDFIHQRTPPLVHRDVNPKNILVRPDGRAALVDFGSVQAALRRPEDVGLTAAGTFGYAPQEQFLGQASARSDLYGLGMTVLAAASGREPEALPLKGIAVDVAAVIGGDPRLERLIEGLVEPDPRRRIASAAEALALLRPLRTAGRERADGREARPAGSGPRADALERLARRLGAQGFSVARGGALGQTALAWRAQREGQGVTGRPLHVVAATAAALVGGADDGKPLGPVPAALFVQAVADAHFETAGGLRRLLGGKPAVVALIACPQGAAPRTRAHVLHSLRESETAVVIPALLDGEGTPELLRPRSMLGGDEATLATWATWDRLVDELRGVLAGGE